MGRQLRALALSPFVGQRLTILGPKEHYTVLERLTELIENGQLVPVIEQTYPLSDMPDAMRQLKPDAHAASSSSASSSGALTRRFEGPGDRNLATCSAWIVEQPLLVTASPVAEAVNRRRPVFDDGSRMSAGHVDPSFEGQERRRPRRTPDHAPRRRTQRSSQPRRCPPPPPPRDTRPDARRRTPAGARTPRGRTGARASPFS